MFRSLYYPVFGVLLAMCLGAPLAKAAEDGQAFGDWVARCSPIEGAVRANAQRCVLTQTQALSRDGEVVGRLLEVTLSPLSGGRVMVGALLPLGIALPRGVALKVDETEQMMMTVQRCTNAGCEAALIVDDSTAALIMAGQQMRIAFGVGADKTATVVVSLLGAAEGMAAVR